VNDLCPSVVLGKHGPAFHDKNKVDHDFADKERDRQDHRGGEYRSSQKAQQKEKVGSVEEEKEEFHRQSEILAG